MNKNVFFITGASILLLGSALACSLGGRQQADNATPTVEARVAELAGPIVSMAVASSIDEQGQLVDPTFTFSPDQPQITVMVQVGEVSASPLEIVWYRVTDEGEEQLFAHTLDVAAFERAYSVGLNSGTLAAGTYKAVATLGDQTREIEWDVSGEQQEMETTTDISETTTGQPPTAGPSGATPQASPAVSETSSSDFQAWAGLGPGNYPLVDLQADTVEIYPFLAYSSATGERAPSSFPEFAASIQGYVNGVGGRYREYQVSEATGLGPQPPFTFSPCFGGVGGDTGSDLPGTRVEVEAYVRTEEVRLILTEESVIILGDDTLGPRIRVISTPARGTKVKPGDKIVLTVTATEKRSGGSWQMGVERIQVIGPEGLVDSQDYQEYRGKACDAKSWEQTYEVTYTVPENPPSQIELCALAEDFAGNPGNSNCGTFYTVDVWEGTLHSESTEGGILNCTEIWDMKLVFTVSADGTIEGAGKGNLVRQQDCSSSALPDHDFSNQAASLAFFVEGTAKRDKLNLQLVLFEVQGGGFNGLLNYSLFEGASNTPAILEIPITAPGIAEGTTLISGAAENGETYSGIHTLELRCNNCEK